MSQMHNLDQLLTSIQSAYGDLEIVKAFKHGSQSLKFILSESNVEAVEDILDTMKETISAQQECSDLLNAESCEDLDDLEMEFSQLVVDAENEKLQSPENDKQKLTLEKMSNEEMQNQDNQLQKSLDRDNMQKSLDRDNMQNDNATSTAILTQLENLESFPATSESNETQPILADGNKVANFPTLEGEPTLERQERLICE